MLTIATILGARPQFIKAATVNRAFRQSGKANEVLIHTGQHFDANMSSIFFEELMGRSPDHNLSISGGSHGVMTGKMLESLDPLLAEIKPDVVLVYGDTNSTLAGALSASKMHIPVAHVEAGLRSFNMKMPEEVNRRLTDHCSDILFTPTHLADKNLANEGVDPARIHQVGDVMFDASVHFGQKAQEQGTLRTELGITDKNYVLATIHRQENTDHPKRLEAIFDGLRMIAKDMPVILPVHPRVRNMVQDIQGGKAFDGIKIIDPLGYLQMVELEQSAAVIVTDSGGVQKEAFFHGVPCVTLRDETEWVELVDAGWNKLISPARGADVIAQAVMAAKGTVGADVQPYGDGKASDKIVSALLDAYS